MGGDYILVLDEGTTSTRALLFAADGSVHGVAQRELTQHYPKPGWVEHDAEEIWERTLACARDMVCKAGGADRIACIGIANQRETVVAWDRASGEPLARAIVWQDRRTAGICEAMREAGQEAEIQSATGLLLDPYFSGTKMRWLIEEDSRVAAALHGGTLAMGTVESWLAYKLTGGALVSDASNVSRTMLMRLDAVTWDSGLCDMLCVPASVLPEVVDNAGMFGVTRPELFGSAIPICGMAGDQQAAAIGQACLDQGKTKATLGTGAFILANMGTEIPRSRHRLLGTVMWQMNGKRVYALEGSVFVAGSLIQWLRDSLGLISSAAETEALARSVEDTGGVTVIPALSGLGAPHWRPEARGLISGLSFSTSKAHIARAALEAVAHQIHELAEAFALDGAEWSSLRIDGGMSANDWLAQDIADLLGLSVERPQFVETTALGAAMLAAVGAGIHSDLPAAASAMRGSVQRFDPRHNPVGREDRLSRWRKALAAS